MSHEGKDQLEISFASRVQEDILKGGIECAARYLLTAHRVALWDKLCSGREKYWLGGIRRCSDSTSCSNGG